MIRRLEQRIVTHGIYFVKFVGTSLDEKPTDHLSTGSVFLEVDTGDRYLFDEDMLVWIKYEGSGSGGGGGGESTVQNVAVNSRGHVIYSGTDADFGLDFNDAGHLVYSETEGNDSDFNIVNDHLIWEVG